MKRQSGFTLVELMIASIIGLVLMASLMNLFITTNRSVALSDGLAQNQETGRFAMDFITKYARLAGYTTDFTEYTPPLIMKTDQADCDADPDLPACTSAVATVITCFTSPEKDACSANNPAGIFGDRIAFPYVANEEVRSCTGSLIPEGTRLANVFWVSSDTATSNELRCRTYDYANKVWLDEAISIVNNVDSLEFQVGIANEEADRNASRYVNLTTIEDNLDITLNRVRSFRVALLTSSMDELDNNKVRTNIQSRKYTLLDGPTITTSDGNLRYIFTNTIELPNLIEGSVFYN